MKATHACVHMAQCTYVSQTNTQKHVLCFHISGHRELNSKSQLWQCLYPLALRICFVLLFQTYYEENMDIIFKIC